MGGKERKENGPAERFGRRAALSLHFNVSRPTNSTMLLALSSGKTGPTDTVRATFLARDVVEERQQRRKVAVSQTRSLRSTAVRCDCRLPGQEKRTKNGKGRTFSSSLPFFERRRCNEIHVCPEKLSTGGASRGKCPQRDARAELIWATRVHGVIVWVIGISDAGQQQDGPQQATTQTHPTTDRNDGRVPRQQCSSRTRSRTQRHRRAQDPRTHGWVWRQRTPAQGLVRLASGSSRPSAQSTDPQS